MDNVNFGGMKMGKNAGAILGLDLSVIEYEKKIQDKTQGLMKFPAECRRKYRCIVRTGSVKGWEGSSGEVYCEESSRPHIPIDIMPCLYDIARTVATFEHYEGLVKKI